MRTADERNRLALSHLTGLLTEAKERPGSWEAPHVEALEDRLAEVFDALTGADQWDDMHVRVDRIEDALDRAEDTAGDILANIRADRGRS